MKFKLFLYILLSAVLLAACHKPVVAQSNNRIMLTQLERGPSIGGSRKGLVGVTNSNGDQRYTFYVNVADTCINWIVYPTGNTTMIDAFVQRCGSDSIWYIDNDGRSMLLAPYGGGGGGDYDWLEIGNNQIPDNINDSIYTYKYAAVGARLVWPTAEFLVNDSVGAALAVIQGSRNARLALYDKNNSTWSMIDHGGSTDLWYTGSGGEVIWKTTAGTPQAPTIPQVKHFRIGLADSTIQMHQYPSTHVDTATITNFLYTDPQGIVRSRPVGDIPGGVSEPASQVVYGTGTGVDSDPRILATPGSSGFQLQVKATAGQGVSVDSTTGAYGVYTSSSGRGSSSWTGLMADRLDGSGTASSTVYNRGTGAAQFYAYSAASQPRSVYDNGTYQVSIGIDSTGLKISNASTLGSYPNYGLTQKSNYVGIKTTNPLDPLHVNGAARISGAIKDGSGSAGSSGQVLTSTGTGWNWAAAPATSPAGSDQQIQFNDSGAFGASSNLVWNGSSVGIGTSSPNASAKLDITSTNSFLLPPRMTTTQRDAVSSPANGSFLYNSTIGNLNVYQGDWRHIVTGSGTLTGTKAALVGGNNNQATGLYSVVIGGDGSKAQAQGAVAMAGTGVQAGASSSLATGSYSATYLSGQVAMAGGTLDGQGTTQSSIYNMYQSITGTTITEVTNPGRAILSGVSNNNRSWALRLQIIASVNTVGNGTCSVGDTYMATYFVGIKRQSNTMSLIGTPTLIGSLTDANMSTSVITISADNTNKSLKVEYTPPSTAGTTTNIRVVVTMYISEIAWN